MLGKLRGILQVIEYLDPTGQEIVHRVPERGSGEIVLGSQCIVRQYNTLHGIYKGQHPLDHIPLSCD